MVFFLRRPPPYPRVDDDNSLITNAGEGRGAATAHPRQAVVRRGEGQPEVAFTANPSVKSLGRQPDVRSTGVVTCCCSSLRATSSGCCPSETEHFLHARFSLLRGRTTARTSGVMVACRNVALFVAPGAGSFAYAATPRRTAASITVPLCSPMA